MANSEAIWVAVDQRHVRRYRPSVLSSCVTQLRDPTKALGWLDLVVGVLDDGQYFDADPLTFGDFFTCSPPDRPYVKFDTRTAPALRALGYVDDTAGLPPPAPGQYPDEEPDLLDKLLGGTASASTKQFVRVAAYSAIVVAAVYFLAPKLTDTFFRFKMKR